jgi:hypothetical protein
MGMEKDALLVPALQMAVLPVGPLVARIRIAGMVLALTNPIISRIIQTKTLDRQMQNLNNEVSLGCILVL